ncbi:hypothetical protein AAU01_20330 [Paenarthrobacter aurescens]|uniref:Uncharacterized protein n=1 Tax=Paenarthrobacter aurescens TaxID=43663 RepID=A0A4Y3NJK5_PAEAU|nr:hypothetical protein AAU01_20330 [Paenarthrobacter aurescens]
MDRRRFGAVRLTNWDQGWLDYSNALVVLDPVVDRAYSSFIAPFSDIGVPPVQEIHGDCS